MQLTTRERPSDSMERQLTGGNRPHRGGIGLATHCCSSHGHIDLLATPYLATDTTLRKTPLESARAGAEDDSPTVDLAFDSGMDLTTSKENMSVEGSSLEVGGKRLQVCLCGWQKVTTLRGLRIHQGRKRCLVQGTQGIHSIDN